MAATSRSIQYIGVNEEVFDLTGGETGSGGFEALETSEGFFHAPKSVLSYSDAYTPGARAGSTKYAPREFTLRVLHSHRDYGSERQWWKAWSTEKDGELHVSSMADGTRRLPVRLSGPPTFESTREPTGTLQADTLPVIAFAPFYIGAPHVVETVFTKPGVQQIEVVNLGDVPAWPIWSATAGTWSFPDGVAGAAGPFVQVHNMPRDFTAFTQNGIETLQDATGQPLYEHLRWQDFRTPIPPDTRALVPVKANQAGKVRLNIPQQFERPWS